MVRQSLAGSCDVRGPYENIHNMPLVPFAMQANSDGAPIVTRNQAENYCCKYCSKFTKGKGQKGGLYDVIDDMERKDAMARDRFGEGYEESKLGGKLHRVFMAEIGAEVCQAEVAHHANRCPEYLLSRNVKQIALYKKGLQIKTECEDSDTYSRG